MGATTIEWTDATWNPIGGCSIKSPGCINCYAQQLAGTRLARHPLYAGTTDTVKGKPVFNGKLTAAADDDAVWTWPLRWRGARDPVLGHGQPSCIFVGDMSDLFHEGRPFEVIDRVFAVMALTPQHTYQVLTKRAERMRAYVSPPPSATGPSIQDRLWKLYHAMGGRHPETWPLPNVWVGTSAERQQEADERIPHLLATPAAVRFVSLEPLLGPIAFRPYTITERPCSVCRFADALSEAREAYSHPINCGWRHDGERAGTYRQKEPNGRGIDWVIVGGESDRDGRSARPLHPDWTRSIRDQCQAAGVPFFFKQWGEWAIATDRLCHSHMETNGAKWVHSDGLVNGPSWFRADKREDTTPYAMIRVGKKAAGRLLDGREWSGMPGGVGCGTVAPAQAVGAP